MRARIEAYLGRHWRWVLLIALPLISLFMHMHLFTRPLQGIHAWRQCETASNVAQFATGDPNLFNPHVYSLEWEDGLKRMEFPIMQWAMGMVVRALGHEVLVMRLMSWLLCIATMFGFFKVCHLLFDNCALALFGAWCWLFSPLLFYYSINPLPDNFSLMAAVWGMAFFLRWYRGEGNPKLLISFLFLSLATATKLPFVVYFALPFGGMLGMLIREKGKNFMSLLGLAFAGLLILAPALAWYAWVIPQWTGNGVIKGILDSSADDIPDLLAILRDTTFSTLPELIVNYAALPFFLWGIWRIFRDRLFANAMALPFGLLGLAIMAYYVFEINMISSVHDYYLFPFLPCIFVLIGIGVQGLWQMRAKWVATAVLVCLLALPVTAALRSYSRWSLKGMSADLITHNDALRAATPADARIIVGHDLSPHITLYHLRHFGWTVSKDNIDPQKIERCLAAGAAFLYSDSRDLESDAAVAPHLDELVGEWGTWRVWGLSHD
jgi:4-amino-4-deoxy-L-arabinose transferase-like glycosyltransferase